MLALAVDDWNDDRARGRLAGRVLLELKVEVEQNRKAIDDVLGYHEQMRESFHKSRQALAKGETWEYPAAFDGLNQILFQRAAYDAALLSHASCSIPPQASTRDPSTHHPSVPTATSSNRFVA